MIDLLNKLERELRLLPIRVGNDAVNFFRANFDKQGFEGDSGLNAWPRTKPRDGKKGKKILQDTGQLKNGIQKRVSGNRIEISVTGPASVYADIHNQGGQIHTRVTQLSKKKFWRLYHQTKNPMYKAMALSKKTEFIINIPKREFIGHSLKLDNIISQRIAAAFNNVFK